MKFNDADWYEWVLPRKEGDVTVFAPTRELAVRKIRQQGFLCDQSKLIQYDRRITDAQHKRGIT